MDTKEREATEGAVMNGGDSYQAIPVDEPRETIQVKPKGTKQRCRACREWGSVCQEIGHEIRDKCQACDCKQCMKNCCSVKRVKDKFPIVKWLPKYRLPHFQGDLIAGMTVGLTVIPQGLAYAMIAELPPIYGLYSAFMGCFIYCVFGTSKDITLGPTAIMSLMTAEFGSSWFHNDPTVAIVLTLMSGLIQFLMGMLHIGFLVEYISYPVINSFTCAAAITIAFGQTKKWLGLTDIPRDFMHQVYWTFKKLPETNVWDFVLGACVMLLLYGMKRMKNIQWGNGPFSTAQRIGHKTIWLIGTARNAIIVILAAGVAAILLNNGIDKLSLTGEITGSLPDFKAPSFSTTDGNVTYTATDIFARIGSGFFIVPVIGLIETIAIGKAFARRNNYIIDANQELIAIGLSNIMGSFVQAYPVTGSFSRTAVNSQSGVRTPMGGIWTAGLVLLALGVLTPLFAYIPDAGLAAVIIMAVLDMVSFEMLIKLWRIKRLDLIPWLATFIFSFVLGIEYGIMVGVGISLMFLLYPWARPGVKVKNDELGPVASINTEEVNITEVAQKEVVVVTLNSGLRFPGIEYVKTKVLKEALRDHIPKPVVLDCCHMSVLDYSTAQGLVGLFEDFKLHKIPLYLADMQPPVLKVMHHLKLDSLHYAPTVQEAIAAIYEELSESDEDNPNSNLLSGQQRSHASSSNSLHSNAEKKSIHSQHSDTKSHHSNTASHQSNHSDSGDGNGETSATGDVTVDIPDNNSTSA